MWLMGIISLNIMMQRMKKMNNNIDKYLKTKKNFAKLMGFLVLLVSFKFSANGFGFNTDDSLFVGYILALAVTASQLIFNTQIRKLNWTIVVIGILSYIYSIWTNIMGFYVYRGETEIVFALNLQSVVSVFSGAFMDVFPEMALAWAYGAGQGGDLIGNLVKIDQVDGHKIISPRKVNPAYNLPKKLFVPNNDMELPEFLVQKSMYDKNRRIK